MPAPSASRTSPSSRPKRVGVSTRRLAHSDFKMERVQLMRRLTAGSALLMLLYIFGSVCEVRGAPVELVVAADGSAKYRTVQEAVMAVPAGTADSPVIIRIKPDRKSTRLNS